MGGFWPTWMMSSHDGWMILGCFLVYGWTLEFFRWLMIQIWYQSSTWCQAITVFWFTKKGRRYEAVGTETQIFFTVMASREPPSLPKKTSAFSSLVGLPPCTSVYFIAISGHSKMLLPMLPHYLIAICISRQQSPRTCPNVNPAPRWGFLVSLRCKDQGTLSDFQQDGAFFAQGWDPAFVALSFGDVLGRVASNFGSESHGLKPYFKPQWHLFEYVKLW